MFDKLTINDINLRGQNVLVRADYNVPMHGGQITDDLRIRASLPTIELLEKKGARRIIIMSHLGRPGGCKVPELSLKPVAERLQELLPKRKVRFVPDVSGPDVEEAVESLPVGGILLLENLRFYPGEEKNSAEFAREIVDCTHADVFVQDGFAVVHRAHASTAAITSELESVAGLLLEREVTALNALLESPKHPFLVIIGGSKVEDKQPLITRLAPLADEIWVGGKIAAGGYTSDNPKVHIVTDFVCDAAGQRLDVSQAGAEQICQAVSGARTILWNGTLGKVEDPAYATGSQLVAEAIGRAKDATSVICGGDTTGFVENLQKTDPKLQYSLISTGGGAALELLSGLSLPGLDNLDEA